MSALYSRAMAAIANLHPGYLSGQYYNDPGLRGTSGFAVTANRLYLVPFLIHRPVVFDRAGLRINTGSSGSCRIGAYAMNNLGQPGALVYDYGTLATTSSSTSPEITGRWAFNPGTYFHGLVFDATPNVLGLSTLYHSSLMGVSGLTGTLQYALFTAFSYAVLPEFVSGSYTATTTAASTPSVLLRAE